MVTDDGFEVGFHGEYREIVPERADRLDRGLRRCPATTSGTLNTAHARRRPAGARRMTDARAGAEQGGSRRDHRLRHGGWHAGRPGPPGAARDLACLRCCGPGRRGRRPGPACRHARGAGRAAAARARDPARSTSRRRGVDLAAAQGADEAAQLLLDRPAPPGRLLLEGAERPAARPVRRGHPRTPGTPRARISSSSRSATHT